ncbi:MAG: DUF4907 domain-containing protein [Bacteroidota bacterium]
MKDIYKYSIVFLTISVVMIVLTYIFVQDSTSEQDYALKVSKPDCCWIYEITKGRQLLIKQEFIPAVKGRQAFKTKTDAEAIGQLVLQKLNNKSIPSITIEEIRAENIIFNDI